MLKSSKSVKATNAQVLAKIKAAPVAAPAPKQRAASTKVIAAKSAQLVAASTQVEELPVETIVATLPVEPTTYVDPTTALQARIDEMQRKLDAMTQEATAKEAQRAAARAEFEARQQAAQPAAPTTQPQEQVMIADQVTASAVQSVMEDMQLPSASRIFFGLAVGLVVAVGVGYVIGYMGLIMMAGAMTLTGSALLANVIYWLSVVIALWKGGKAGYKVCAMIATGRIDQAIGSAIGWVRNLGTQPAPAISNGAFVHPATA